MTLQNQMGQGIALPLAPEDIRALRQMQNWIRKFSLTGPGVVMSKNTPETYSAYISGGGSVNISSTSTIPKPTQRYQVYTPIDDTLKPIWTYPRFSS